MVGSGEWIVVARTAEFASTDRKQVCVGGQDIAVFRIGDAYHAVANVCTHARALMIGGLLEGYEIECPLHGARFDVRDGRVLTPPATKGLAVYAVRVESDVVSIRV